MPRPAVRPVIRIRPTKTYLKYLKHAWKPFPSDEEAYWGLAAAKYLRHTANLRPDAYVRLSDLNTSGVVPPADPDMMLEWVQNDHLRRFETINEAERVEGMEGWHRRWFIRAKHGHSIPGVDIGTNRIMRANQNRSLVFATTPENWPLIEKHNGIIPSIPNLHTPRLRNPNFTYFAQNLATLIPQYFTSYPAKNNTPEGKLVQLHIGINVKEAMDLGIKFFRNRRGQVLTTGLGGDRRVPMEVFNHVFVTAVKRRMVFRVKEEEKGEKEKDAAKA